MFFCLSCHSILLSRRNSYVGVTWNRRAAKWEVRIYAAGRNTYLGSYDTDVAAAQK
jgi:hypothetical protein